MARMMKAFVVKPLCGVGPMEKASLMGLTRLFT